MKTMFISLMFFVCAVCFSCKPDGIDLRKEPQITSAAFAGSDRAWITSLAGEILRTEDGGKNWIKANVAGVRFEQIGFLDQLRGWAVSDEGSVWKSVDGGRSWAVAGKLKATENSRYHKAVQLGFVDEKFGWIVDAFSVWCTRDGGANWSQCFSSATPGRGEGWPKAYFYLDSRHSWIAATNGEVYRTLDGGLTWQRTTISPDSDFNAIQFVDEREGWVAGWPHGGIYHTTDGGVTWDRQLQETVNNNIAIDGIAFTSRSEGWAVGRIWPSDLAHGTTRGTILRTTNGGRDWTPVDFGHEEILLARIYFRDVQNGWLISGTKIYRTSDGGRTWSVTLKV